MDTMIKEINESLNLIIDGLAQRQEKCTEALNVTEGKIAEKIEEAKKYKTEVESTKAKIKGLEDEIANLEVDLEDLNERFGKKDFAAIVEAGNREISAKIAEKQNAIAKHRNKIGELTEKARNIKDLLINLRKDKATKEERLAMVTKAYNYYQESLSKIMVFAEENPGALETYANLEEPVYQEYTEGDTIAGAAVFDEIESMDQDDEESDADDQTDENIALVIEEEPETEEPTDELALNDIYEKLKAKSFQFAKMEESEEEVPEDLAPKYDDILVVPSEPVINITEEELNNPVTEEVIIDDPKPVEEPAESLESIEIVAPTEESAVPIIEPPVTPEIVEKDSGSNELADFLGNNEEVAVTNNTNEAELQKFLQENTLELTGFNAEDQEYLKNAYNAESFNAIINVLKQNHIDLNSLYDAANVLSEVPADELDRSIGQLLLANQTTENIGFILDKLSKINSADLKEAIGAFGPAIKDASIMDIINKARAVSGKSEPVIPNISYLTDLGFAPDEINNMINTLPATALENLTLYSKIAKVNYSALNKFNISNIKTAFSGYSHMFLVNPDRFASILDKYDPADLVRCIEKNAAVIEKL